MFSSPLVSVVIPFYNVERYIGYALTSVLNQTYSNLEIILIDDGSLDESLNICLEFKDQRIKIIRQINMGLAAARNTGILNATGEFIALLDSDDAMMPDKIEQHVLHLQSNPHIGLSYAGSSLINEDNQPINIFQTPKLGLIQSQDIFCGKVILNGSVPVFRRKALWDCRIENQSRMGFFDESLRRSEDVEFWTRFSLSSGWITEGIPGHYTEYRITRQGLSADIEKQLASWEEVFLKIKLLSPDFIKQYGTLARAFELRYLARRAFQMKAGKLSFSLVTKSILTNPYIILKEPKKTITTLLGCGALAILPDVLVQKMLKIAKVNV